MAYHVRYGRHLAIVLTLDIEVLYALGGDSV